MSVTVPSPSEAADRVHADEGIVELYRAHYRSLVRMATLLVDDVGSAEEVVQDAFVKVHAAWNRITDPGAAVPYLRATVMNLARSRLRRRRVARLKRVPDDAPSGSPEDQAVLSEDHREVLVALRSLSARQRECLTLRYYLDLNDEEIARTLGISLGSAKTHIRRGLAAVTRHMEERA